MDFYFKYKFWSEVIGGSISLLVFLTWCGFAFYNIVQEEKNE